MLPKHLYPNSYWELRTELLESSFRQITDILRCFILSPPAQAAVDSHMIRWLELHKEIMSKFPDTSAKFRRCKRNERKQSNLKKA